MDFSKKSIVQEYCYKLELHSHSSPASGCSEIPPEELVQNYKALGYDAVTITNHFIGDKNGYIDIDRFMSDYHRAVAEGERQGVRVLLGMEIRFDENHNDYLVYGIDEADVRRAAAWFPLGIERFCREFKNDRNLIIQAHPFRDGMEKVSPSLLDGIEVFNMHPNHNSRIGIAAAYAKANGLLPLCGTDYHHPGHQGLGSVRTKKLPEDSFELAEILVSRDYIFDISGFIVLP